MNAAVFVMRVVLGGLLVVTGALKVGHAPDLAAAIAGFRLLPAGAVGPLALALPFFELLLGGYLVAGLFTRTAGYRGSRSVRHLRGRDRLGRHPPHSRELRVLRAARYRRCRLAARRIRSRARAPKRVRRVSCSRNSRHRSETTTPMNQRSLTIITVVIVLLIAAGAGGWYYLHPSKQLQTASQSPVIGKATLGATAPEFVVATTSGLFDLEKTDKPVFLEIFATWCPHCQRETAVIDKLYAKYQSQMDFVGVSGSDTAMDGTSAASQNDVLAWIQKFDVKYPVAYDPLTARLRRPLSSRRFPDHRGDRQIEDDRVSQQRRDRLRRVSRRYRESTAVARRRTAFLTSSAGAAE